MDLHNTATPSLADPNLPRRCARRDHLGGTTWSRSDSISVQVTPKKALAIKRHYTCISERREGAPLDPNMDATQPLILERLLGVSAEGVDVLGGGKVRRLAGWCARTKQATRDSGKLG